MSRATPDAELLSPLRLRLVRMTANGYRDAETAALLRLSINTVSGELWRARRQLGARNRVHAVAICLALGLISPDEIDLPGEEPQP